jgi:hypothetical protein
MTKLTAASLTFAKGLKILFKSSKFHTHRNSTIPCKKCKNYRHVKHVVCTRIKIENTCSSFERVEEFKYLGTTLTNQTSIQEDVKSGL